MENASKALLIAGAILIVILLIAVGMMVYNSSRGSIDEAVSQMSSQEMEMFNKQFTQYSGTKVSGSNVKALIERVNSNNVVNNAGPKNVTIINSPGVAAVPPAPAIPAANVVTGNSTNYAFNGADANTARQYSVVITDTNADGLVDQITLGN